MSISSPVSSGWQTYKDFDQNIHTGRYAIRPNDNVYHVYSRFSRGYQEKGY